VKERPSILEESIFKTQDVEVENDNVSVKSRTGSVRNVKSITGSVRSVKSNTGSVRSVKSITGSVKSNTGSVKSNTGSVRSVQSVKERPSILEDSVFNIRSSRRPNLTSPACRNS